jgi:hypothetical protein
VAEFKTEFINLTNASYPIYEADGQAVDSVPADSILTLSSDSALTLWARYERIIIKGSGLELVQRPGWREPELGEHVVECVNRDGSAIEKRRIGFKDIWLPQFVLVRVAVPANSPDALTKRFEIKRIATRQKNSAFPGYYFRRERVEDVRTVRSQNEIAAVLEKNPTLKPPEEMKPEEEQVFRCKIKNATKHPITIHEAGLPMFDVDPGCNTVLEAYDATKPYARFSEVVYGPDGISYKNSDLWKNPYSGQEVDGIYSVEFLDLDPKSPLRVITVRDRFLSLQNYVLPKGLPVVLPASAFDNVWCFYSRVVFDRKIIKRPYGKESHYSDVLEQPVVEHEKRPEAEVLAILAYRKNRYPDITDADAKRILAMSAPEFVRELVGAQP